MAYDDRERTTPDPEEEPAAEAATTEPRATDPTTTEPTANEPAGSPVTDPSGTQPSATEPSAAEFETPPSPPPGPRDTEAWPHEPVPPPREAEAYPAPPTPAVDDREATSAHSVPATTTVGESTQCPRCGTENRPGVAFCRNCGQRLVAAGVPTTVERPGAPEGSQQCPRCGTHNRAGVAFCQNCGANLRVVAAPAPGYVPPMVQQVPAPRGAAAAGAAAPARGGAVLGPLVLLVGAAGLVTAWMLPFAYGAGSLWDRSFGVPGGYGVSFWNGYAAVTGGLLDSAYFGFAAAAPILVALLVLLALGGFLRGAPGVLQIIGLLIAVVWSIGLVGTFIGLEVVGNWNGDLVGLLRAMTPAGIIFLLAALIVLIGSITRLARS
jgi:hypothetical protein